MKSVLLFLFLCATSLFAQNKSFFITGTALDSEEKSGLSGARVQALRKDSTLAGGSITDKNGHFTFRINSAGTYTLKIQSVGFQAYLKSFTVGSQDTLKLGKIRLAVSSVKTGEVEVSDRAVRVEVRGDTIDYTASSFKTEKNAVAEDLIKKMPGIQVEADGSVKAQGENVKRVLVDGKPFFGDDPTLALKNLPSEVIERVQVIDQMSDQSQFTRFDDGDRVKTLNIVTKQDRRNGQFGKIYGGYGTDDRFSGGGNVNFFGGDRRISVIGLTNNINQQNFSIQDILGAMNGGRNTGMAAMAGSMMRMFGGGGGGRGGFGGGGGGFGGASNFLVPQSDGISAAHALGVNYADSWGKSMNVSGSYFVNYTDNQSDQQTLRQNFLDSASQNVRQENISGTQNLNHRLNLRLDYTIDTLNSILLTPRLTFQSNDASRTSANRTESGTGSLLNTSDSRTVTENSGVNFGGEALYRRRFETDGRTFSANIRTTISNNSTEGTNSAKNAYYSIDLGILDSLNQTTPSDGKSVSLGGNLTYTEPIHKDGSLQFNYDFNTSESKSDKSVFDKLPIIGNRLNALLSNTASTTYLTHRPGITYRLNFGSASPDTSSRDKNSGGGMFGGMGGGGGFGGMMRMFGGGGRTTSSLSFGLEYQLAELSVDQTYPLAFSLERKFSNLMPSISYNTRFSMTSNLRLNYRTSTNQPSIKQLQNVVDNSNPLQLSVGNPRLNQEFSHNFSANYGFFNMQNATSFFIYVSGTITADKIANSTVIAERDTLIGTEKLGAGSQLTRTINRDGYWNARAFSVYSFPFEPFSGAKMNMNVNLGGTYTRDVGLINDAENITDNYGITPAIGISSNISENLDFTISGRTTYTIARNSIQRSQNSNFYTHIVNFRLNYIFLDGIIFSTDFNYTANSGLTGNNNQGVPLLNLGLGKRLFDNDAEIRFSVFDVLNKNNSYARTVGSGYIEDTETKVLGRYALLTFTYFLRAFGGK